MVKLKGVPFSILNDAARKFVSTISENESLVIVSYLKYLSIIELFNYNLNFKTGHHG